MSDNSTYMCPVCGYPGLHEPPRADDGGGSYEICWSCGFEFGVTDDDLGFTDLQWRERWISAGTPWSARHRVPAPAGWDPVAQLETLLRLEDGTG